MPREHGKVVTQPINLGDNVVVARTLADYAVGSGDISSGAIVAAKLRAYQVNTSVPDQSSLTLSHNLGTAPTMYGLTLISHVSSYGVTPNLGSANNSQLTIRLLASGSGQVVPVSGLFVNVWAIAP